jgi:hypothetical protein
LGQASQLGNGRPERRGKEDDQRGDGDSRPRGASKSGSPNWADHRERGDDHQRDNEQAPYQADSTEPIYDGRSHC